MQKQADDLVVSPMRANTFFYGLAVISERAVSFLIIPLLTKTLPQELYAIWTQIIVTTGLLSPTVVLGFHTTMIQFLAGENNTRKVSNVFHGMAVIIFFNLCVVIAATFLFNPSLSRLIFGNTAYAGFVYLFGFFLAAEVLFELTISFLRSQNRIKLLSIYSFLKNTVRITILVLTLLLFKFSFFYCILFTILAQLGLDALIYALHIFNRVGISLCFKEIRWKEILSFSLPLVPYSIFILGNSFVDRYLILATLGIKQVSIYALAYTLAGITGLFYVILGFTLYPHSARFWNKGDKAAAAAVIGKGVGYYLFFTAPLIAILTIMNIPLIKMISTSQYISHWQVIFFLAMAVGLFGLHQLNVYPFLFANKTKAIVCISAITLVTNLIFNLILIPRAGILGAALAAFISNALLMALTVIIARRYLVYRLPLYVFTKIILATTVMSLFLLAAAHYVNIDNIYKLASIILFGIAIYASIDLLSKNSFLIHLKGGL